MSRIGLVLLLALLLSACSPRVVNLSEHPILSASNIAVVLSLYARVHRYPSDESIILFPLRRGDILTVLDEIILPRGRWFKIQYNTRIGWIIEDEVRFVQTIEQAENLSTMVQ